MGFIKVVVAAAALIITSSAWSQTNRYMVFFKDKLGSSYSITNPAQYLTPKAIARRSKQGIVINQLDIPVNQQYIDGVRNVGTDILFRTRWMNGVLIQCSPAIINQVAALSYVTSTELVAPGIKPPSANGRKKSGKDTKENHAPATSEQLAMLGIDKMHESGYHGEGISIAIFDSGFIGVNSNDVFTDVISEGRLTSYSFDFVHKSANVFHYDDHGSRTFSILAAYKPDVFTGGAYKANFTLYITEDDPTEYKIEEYNWLFAAERSDSLGIDIISSSLGYNTFDISSMDYEKSDMDGLTAVSTRAATWASDRGMVVVVSAGNEGSNSWQVTTAPADAENVLAVGGITSSFERSPSSSKGPTADGRIKPDVVALGVGVAMIPSNGSISSGTGTSYSAPLVSCLAAGVWQRYPFLSSKELVNILKETASQSSNPDNFVGYGIPNFLSVVNRLDWVPQVNSFDIFPNPIIHNSLTIRPSSPDVISSCTIEIISAQGQVMERKTINFSWLNSVYQADCSTLSAGVYFLHIISGNQFLTTKLVKI